MAWTLKIIGATCSASISVFIAVIVMVHVGAINPYPTPPDESLHGPLGRVGEVRFLDLYRRAAEPIDAYHKRLTLSVSRHMVHWWPAEDRYAVGVHPLDNYLLWIKSFVPGYEHFANKEFVSPLMAWRRGYGFCSQVSRIVYSVLREQGLDATVMQHASHVVTEAGGSILDADYGVFIPHSLAYMQEHPSEVAKYYSDYPSMIEALTQIYTDDWTETASKTQFDYTLALEQEAQWIKWTPVLALLWLSIAILDAGFCWPRFRESLRTGCPSVKGMTSPTP
jgi:hypothetical protein